MVCIIPDQAEVQCLSSVGLTETGGIGRNGQSLAHQARHICFYEHSYFDPRSFSSPGKCIDF